MERFTMSSIFAGALLGLSSLASLGSVWMPSGGAGAPGGAPGKTNGWRLGDPVTYENLTIFPVLSGESARTSGFATLDEALSTGDAVISEEGSEALRRTRDGRPVIVPDYHRPAIASSPQGLASFLADDRVAGAQRLVQRREAAGPRGFPAQHRKDGQVFVSHRVAEPPAIRFSRRATRRTCAAARHPHRPERRQRAKSQQRSRENRRHRKSLHKLLLILPSGPFAGLCGLNGAWGISCRVFSGCGRLRHTERWSMGQRGRGDFV